MKKCKWYTYTLNYSDDLFLNKWIIWSLPIFSLSLLFSLLFLSGTSCSAFLDLFKTLGTIPAVSKVLLRSLGEAHARKMEPFVLAVWMVACDHVTVRNILAEAVGLLHLVSHGLYLVQVRSELASWAALVAPALTKRSLGAGATIACQVCCTNIELLDSLRKVWWWKGVSSCIHSAILASSWPCRPQFGYLRSMTTTCRVSLLTSNLVITWTNCLFE